VLRLVLAESAEIDSHSFKFKGAFVGHEVIRFTPKTRHHAHPRELLSSRTLCVTGSGVGPGREQEEADADKRVFR
jgi:hypothetical protein